MTKTIWILAISAAFVVGSITTSTIAFAGDDGGSFLCPVGQAVTGIVLEDDDEITDLFCAELGGGDVSVTGFYVEQDQFLQNLGTSAIIMEKQFTVDNDATVFISSTVPIFPQSTNDMILYLVVDGTIVHQSLSRNIVSWNQHNLSWTGDLEAGPHTIQVTTSASANQVARFNCAGPDFCNLNILVFE